MAKEKDREKGLNSLLWTSVFLGFTVCVYAPFEMYLANRQEFWFSLSQFAWLPLAFGCAAVIFAMFVGRLLRRWKVLSRIYLAGIFGVGIACYLQGNFLNLKVGIINGAVVDWAGYRTRILCNGLIWGLILIGILIFALRDRREIFLRLTAIASAFLTAVQMVSLITLLVVNRDQYGETPNTQFLSKEGLFEVSQEENILIFLMDAFDDAYMKEILAQYPEETENLEGFTYFSNMVGSYPSTLYSVQYLLSGYYNLNEAPFAEWRRQLGEMPLYWDDLEAAGWKYYLYEDSAAEVAPDVYVKAENYEDVPLRIGDYFGFTHDLYQLVACRYFPDFVKPSIWLDGSEFDFREPVYGEYEAFNYYNASYVEDMKNNPLRIKDSGKEIKFIHLEGAHSPNYLNENGEVGENACERVDSARGCLKIVGNIIEQLKTAGCYDNSAIIIMADHGYSKDGVLTNPVFLVKPQNAAREPLQVSNAPVSHLEYPATIMMLAGDEECCQYGETVFDIEEGAVRERHFYQYYYENELENYTLRLIEYSVAPESNDRSGFQLTDVEYMVNGEKIQHSVYCKTCQEGGISQEEYEKYDPPREVHEKGDNYPLKD